MRLWRWQHEPPGRSAGECRSLQREGTPVSPQVDAGLDAAHAAWNEFGQPNTALMGFGSVRHTRLRPRRNSFEYPTYFLMLPLRAMRDASSAGTPLARNRRALLSFFDCDHGDGRPPEQGGALGWIEDLLGSEGIHDARGEIWLHCYPRVLGYAFKPVSFWFCHRAPDDREGALRAIVVEVNNTFGERHFYLLDEPSFGSEQQVDKVFHVSPFCEVEGRYRFRFMRVARNGCEKTLARIDYDDDQGPLLQTSVSGDLHPITQQIIRRALWRYPLMTLGVMFHIHFQALRLWLKRVKYFRKPVAPALPVSR